MTPSRTSSSCEHGLICQQASSRHGSTTSSMTTVRLHNPAARTRGLLARAQSRSATAPVRPASDMHLNAHVALCRGDVLLVPYGAHHVPRYHQWMSDAELREATASELLTLEQEYDMQRSWREDEDKLTFISLKRRKLAHGAKADKDYVDSHTEDDMVGDINVFLSQEPIRDDNSESMTESSNTERPTSTQTVAEISLMVAEKAVRRKGFATQVLQTFLPWTSKALKLEPRRFFVRIGMDNEQSIALFEKLGFVKTKESQVFREVELRWPKNEWDWQDDVTVISLQ